MNELLNLHFSKVYDLYYYNKNQTDGLLTTIRKNFNSANHIKDIKEYKSECQNNYTTIKASRLLNIEYEPINHIIELHNWYNFIMYLLSQGAHVYIKGGSVLGLKVSQLLITKNREIDKLPLELIRDWDFTVITDEPYIIECVEYYNLHKEGKTMIILRNINNITICNGTDCESLFEMSIKTTENLSDLELPMTTMKIRITNDNLILIFKLAGLLIKCNNLQLNVCGPNKDITVPNIIKIKEIIQIFDIIIPISENGLFKVDNSTITENINYSYDTGGLSLYITDIIYKISDNINIRQFLISHIIQPDRLLIRYNSKNKIKSNKIIKLLKDNDIDASLETWLLSNCSEYDDIINTFFFVII